MNPLRYSLALALAALPLAAQALTLQWPVDCTLGKDCFVQSYADRNPTPSAHDFTCGPSSYDKHDGTDIRLRNLAAMRAGVTVHAAADGIVVGTRDGMADTSIRDTGKEAVNDRECGNGVRIQHADGYVTQSCHMKLGSIRVRNGQQVKAGDALGQVGLSGQTEFPHLHLGVWKAGVAIDPFDNRPIQEPCDARSATHAKSLWSMPIPYQPTALLGDGFVDTVPNKDTVRDTPPHLATASTAVPTLVYWFDIMGIRAGDVLSTAITAPDGKVLAEKTQTMPKPLALYFGYIGKRNSSGALAPGTYRAAITLKRGANQLVRTHKEIVIR